MAYKSNLLRKIIGISLKRKESEFGFVEYISTGEVSGWTYSEKWDIEYVGFFIGKSLISYGPVDILRET